MSELHTLVAGLSWSEPCEAATPAPGKRRRQLATGIGAAMLGIAGVSAAAPVDVTVGEADWAADDAVALENMFNDAAPAGTSYVMVPVTVSNVAAEAVTPRAVVSITYRSIDGRTFAPSRQVVPADLDEAAAIARGESVTGNVLFAIPADAQRAGEWVVEVGADAPAPLTFTAA